VPKVLLVEVLSCAEGSRASIGVLNGGGLRIEERMIIFQSTPAPVLSAIDCCD